MPGNQNWIEQFSESLAGQVDNPARRKLISSTDSLICEEEGEVTLMSNAGVVRRRCLDPPSCGCFEMAALHCVQSGRTVSFHFMLHGLACALSTRRFDRIPVQTALLRRPGT